MALSILSFFQRVYFYRVMLSPAQQVELRNKVALVRAKAIAKSLLYYMKWPLAS